MFKKRQYFKEIRSPRIMFQCCSQNLQPLSNCNDDYQAINETNKGNTGGADKNDMICEEKQFTRTDQTEKIRRNLRKKRSLKHFKNCQKNSEGQESTTNIVDLRRCRSKELIKGSQMISSIRSRKSVNSPTSSIIFDLKRSTQRNEGDKGNSTMPTSASRRLEFNKGDQDVHLKPLQIKENVKIRVKMELTSRKVILQLKEPQLCLPQGSVPLRIGKQLPTLRSMEKLSNFQFTDKSRLSFY